MGGDGLGGAHHSKTVKSGEEGALGFFGFEEVAEDRAFHLKRLGPTVRAFSDGIGEVIPKLPEDLAGVEGIAGDSVRAGAFEVDFGFFGVRVPAFLFGEEAEAYAGIEEEFGGAFVGVGNIGEGFGGDGRGFEDTEFDGGEHRFGAAEAVEEVEDHWGRKWSQPWGGRGWLW